MTSRTIIRFNIDILRTKLAEEQNPMKRQEMYRLLAEERAKLAAMEADLPIRNKNKKPR